MRYFDAAPMYVRGLRRKRCYELVLSSKVGCVLKPAPRACIDFAP